MGRLEVRERRGVLRVREVVIMFLELRFAALFVGWMWPARRVEWDTCGVDQSECRYFVYKRVSLRVELLQLIGRE